MPQRPQGEALKRSPLVAAMLRGEVSAVSVAVWRENILSNSNCKSNGRRRPSSSWRDPPFHGSVDNFLMLIAGRRKKSDRSLTELEINPQEIDILVAQCSAYAP